MSGESLFKSLADFEERDAEWLVYNLIPRKNITIIAGDGGVGKTTLWCDIVASISSGKRCVLDNHAVSREPGLVMAFATEDSVREKLKRKMRIAGADENNIIMPDYGSDTEGELQKYLFSTQDLTDIILDFKPALVVFDPIQAFVPPEWNMGARNVMRRCLAPLKAIGEQIGTTFIVICHTNKRDGAWGRNRLADSGDIYDIARSVLIVGEAEDGTRYISHDKSNYGELQSTKLFAVDDKGLISITGETFKKDRDFVQEKARLKKATTRQDCRDWIMHELGAQPDYTLLSVALKDRAVNQYGYSEATYNRTYSELVKENTIFKERRGGKDGKWYTTLRSVLMT